VGPDLHGSALILVGWIRIRSGNADLDPGGHKGATKIGKSDKISWFKVLDSPLSGLKVSPVNWTSFMEINKLQFFIQKLDFFHL
jgi:hypothetical protein